MNFVDVKSIVKVIPVLIIFEHHSSIDFLLLHHIWTFSDPPGEWRRPYEQSRSTWTRGLEKDLAELNFGLHREWQKIQDRAVFGHFPNTVTLGWVHHQRERWVNLVILVVKFSRIQPDLRSTIWTMRSATRRGDPSPKREICVYSCDFWFSCYSCFSTVQSSEIADKHQ